MAPVATRHPNPAATLCPDCQEAVIQVQTSTAPGVLVVDADPTAGGTVVVGLDRHGVAHGGQVGTGQAAGMRAAGKDLHAPHATSCPFAGRPARSRPGYQRAQRARR